MKNVLLYKIILGVFFLIPTTTFAITPPVITATGNQIYCPGSSLKIVETISITNDSAEPDTDAMYIQVSSGYVFGQDQLTLNNPSLHPTITTSWNALEGKLKLHNPFGLKVTYIDFVNAIKDIVFSNSSTSPSGVRNFSITIGQANYLPSTGHYYEYIPSIGITWTNAKTAAEFLNYYGLKGYLATILTLDEAKLTGEQSAGAGWIGGSDAVTEGVWKWVTGPEGLANGGTGIIFWYGLSNGYTPSFAYWNTNEPNQAGDEDYAHITAPGVGIPGSWNDMSNTGNPSGNYQPKGYIVEYGGMPGDPILQISASTTITIPRIETTTSNTMCVSGSMTLQATTSNGTVNWYNSITGGTLIGTGNSFITPFLTTTTSYFVDATNGNCPTVPRTEIIATINPIPTITATISNSRCDSGTVILGASASTGTINWYNTSTGGTSLGTGTTFTTPSITASTTYYADATANTCTSPTRTAVIATINNSPSITSTISASRCDAGTLNLGAIASGGTIRWYDVATGGTSLGTGTTYSTPIIASTTTYYTEAYTTTCTSPTRTAVTATITNTPTITSTTSNSRCNAGTVSLGAIASAGTINWYNVATGGTILGTGTTFTTPTINTTTTYYVDAVANGCTTPTRTAIIATVDTTPTITSTTPNSRCDSGFVTLSATSSDGFINWYDESGKYVAIGNSFTTPILTTTTTYYVDATTNSCTSPARKAVIATVYPVSTSIEQVVLCQGETTTLDASIPNMNYLWSPGGETTQTISISSIGNYNVTISSPTVVSCDSKKNISVIEYPAPIINSILVNENSITIELADKKSYYEYSINGIDFQASNQFSYIPSGNQTAFVRAVNSCNLTFKKFTIFTISKYFTPNNDGQNDFWLIKEMEDFTNSRVEIFDRYGKLLKQLNSSNFGWNGIYNGIELPSDDYWYRLKLDDSTPIITGHFTLKR
jgi:gliding motility-associated-like protein